MMRKILTKKFFERSALKIAPELLWKFLCNSYLGQVSCFMICEVEAYDGFNDKASHASRGRTERNAPMFGEAGRWYVYFTYGMHWMLNIVTGPKDYPAAVLIRAVAIWQPEQFLASFSPSQRWAPKLQPFRSSETSETMPKKLQKSARNSRLAPTASWRNVFTDLAQSRHLGTSREIPQQRDIRVWKNIAPRSLDGPAKLTKFLKIDKQFNNLPASRKTGLWIEDRGVKIPMLQIKRTPRIGVDYAGEWAKKKYRFVLLTT